MNVKHLAILTLFFVASVPAISADIQAFTAQHVNPWKPIAGSVSCEYWNKDKEFRCLLNDRNNLTATIEISNIAGKKVRLTYGEYHSSCSSSSNRLISEFYEVPPSGSVTLDVLNAGAGITCREGFVKGCDIDDGNGGWKLDVACPSAVEVKYRLWKGNLN